MKNTLADSWAQWDEIVLGPRFSGVDRRDLRYAFYCGAMAFSALLRDAVEASHDDPVAAIKAHMIGVTDELNEFYKELIESVHAKAN
jgi:hypothetical protein